MSLSISAPSNAPSVGEYLGARVVGERTDAPAASIAAPTPNPTSVPFLIEWASHSRVFRASDLGVPPSAHRKNLRYRLTAGRATCPSHGGPAATVNAIRLLEKERLGPHGCGDISGNTRTCQPLIFTRTNCSSKTKLLTTRSIKTRYMAIP